MFRSHGKRRPQTRPRSADPGWATRGTPATLAACHPDVRVSVTDFRPPVPESIVIPGPKLDLAMQLILTPMILQLMERARQAR